MIEQVTLGELVDQAPVERAGNAKHVVLSMTRGMGLVPQTAVFDKVIASRDLSNYKVVQPNQLVVGIHIDEGALGFSAPDQKGIVSPAYTLWNLRNPNGIHTPYLHRFIRSEQAVSYFVSKYRETAERRGKLTREQFLALQIPLPPLAEQKRIAAILDAADALRAKRREALAQLDTLLQSTFLDMFGDPVTNPKGWKQCELGSICDVGSSRRVFVEELVEEGVPFYRGTEIGLLGEGKTIAPQLFITQEHFHKLKEHSGVPRPGDLLLPSICPDGRIFTVRDEKPFYFKDGRVLWIKAAESGIDSTFLRYHLKHVFATDYAKIASGTTFAELKIFALKALVVHVPPPERQAHFARFVELYEQQLAGHREHLAELDTLFASLQSRAFRGELDAG